MSEINKTYLVLFFLLFSFSITNSQNLVLNGNTVNIPDDGTSYVYDNVIFQNKNSILNINGTLIVRGDMDLTKKDSQLNMGPNGVLIVYGNIDISTTITLNLQNYVILQGELIGSNGAGNSPLLNIDDTHLYILGTISSLNSLSSCGENYSGTTMNINDTCNYGDEAALISNFEGFPDAIKDKLSCYNLGTPATQDICPGSPVTFTVTNDPELNYTWQVKGPGDAKYYDIAGATSSSYSIGNVSEAMDQNKYRVIAKTNLTGAAAAGTCKITISKAATLNVLVTLEWLGTENADWNNIYNWRCLEIPGIDDDVIVKASADNFPIVNSGSPAQVKNLEIESGANLEIFDNHIEITGSLTINGSLDSDNGKIILSGSETQTFGKGLLNNEIQDLEINNLNGVNLDQTLNLSGTLFLKSGNLASNANLILLSNSNRTALIDGSGAGSIIGEVSMQRFIDPAYGYKYISTPFSNSTVGDFSSYVDLASDFSQFYAYEENREDSNNNDATGWTQYTEASNALNPMEGYAINLGENTAPINIQLKGLINDGNFQKTLENNDGKYTKGFHLVGNPYPSPINWNSAAGWTRTNIGSAAYFYSNSTDDPYAGSYTSYVSDISSSGTADGIIPSMQGFFIHVDDGTTGTFGMTNEVRINDYDQAFFKAPKTEKSLIRISAEFEDNELKDALVIYFDSFAKISFESDKDALKLFNTSTGIPNFYMLSEEKELSINAVPGNIITENQRIPLGFQTKRSGEIKIRLQDFENLDKSTRVFIIDRKKGIKHDLADSDYQFFAAEGTINSRFFLSFDPTETGENLDDQKFIFESISKDHSISVRMNQEAPLKGQLQLRSIDGKLLFKRKVSGKDQVTIDNIKTSGVYLLSFNDGSRNYVKKVIVK